MLKKQETNQITSCARPPAIRLVRRESLVFILMKMQGSASLKVIQGKVRGADDVIPF